MRSMDGDISFANVSLWTRAIGVGDGQVLAEMLGCADWGKEAINASFILSGSIKASKNPYR